MVCMYMLELARAIKIFKQTGFLLERNRSVLDVDNVDFGSLWRQQPAADTGLMGVSSSKKTPSG